jgi:hypothetical protein
MLFMILGGFWRINEWLVSLKAKKQCEKRITQIAFRQDNYKQ